MCIKACIASEYLGDNTAEEDALSFSIFMVGLAAVEDAEARHKFLEGKRIREEEDLKARLAAQQERLIVDTWLAIQARANEAQDAGQHTVDVPAKEWFIVSARYMRNSGLGMMPPTWSDIIMIPTWRGAIEVRIVADPSGDQLVERP